MNYTKFFSIAAAAFCVCAISACKQKAESTLFPEEKLYQITQFETQPFLGETYVNDYDYDKGNNFLVEHYKNPDGNGACSSFRYGDFAARNLDWFIKDYALLVVHTAANPEKQRYASVAIVSSNPYVNREMIAGGVVNDEVQGDGVAFSDWRSIFPVFTTDGINEMGVCVNTNIVLHEPGIREGYIPCTGKPGQKKTSFVSLPRFILDNCASCDDAIRKCGELSLVQAYTGPLAAEDSHILVSDMQKSVVIEWINNEMVYTEYPRSNNFRSEEGMPAIMTNFYNKLASKHIGDNGSIKLDAFLPDHPWAMGVERYETLNDGYDQVNSVETAAGQIEKVLYSNFYNIDNKWYTENGGSCILKDKDWYYPVNGSYQKAEGILDAIHKTYEPGGYQEGTIKDYGTFEDRMRDLDKGIESDKWYTELTDVFDIKNKELYVMPQEGWYKHEYIKFSVSGE